MAATHSNNSILRESIRLVGSGAAGQVVALLLLAVIGRQYDQETMGVLGSFLSWGGLLAIASGARYEQGIVVARAEDEAHTLYHLALRISLIFTLILLPIALVIGYTNPSLTPLGTSIYALPFFVLLSTWYNASALWELRHKRYKILAKMQFIKGVGNNLLKAVFGFVAATIGSLITAQILSLVATFPLFFRSLKRGSKAPKTTSLGSVAKKYRGFPRYGIVQALIDNLLGSLLVLMLPLRYGLAEVGYLTMAIMLARRPLQLVAENLSNVYFQRLSECVSQRLPIRPLAYKLLRNTLIVSIPTVLLLAQVAPYLVSLVVGDKWLPSAHIVVWMLPMCIPNFLNSILNTLPDIFAHQRQNMWAQVVMLVLDVTVIALGFTLFDFDRFVPFFYLFIALEQVGYLLFLLRFVWHYERTLGNTTAGN